MNFQKVIIKQIADDNDSAFGLAKYNRSRFPNCTDAFQVPFHNGRYVTGIDPNGLELTLIKDPEVREEKKREREALTKNLQEMLPGVDISPTSSFWEDFKILINTNQDLILNKSNPLDVIKYHALVEGGYAAPSKDEVGSPRYKNAKYYCLVEEVEEKEKYSVQKLRDKATAELVKISENKDFMLIVGKYLEGTKYKDGMLAGTIYTNLSEFLNDRKNSDHVDKFLKAVKLPLEDLQFKVTIDTALRKKLIKFSNGQYNRGGINLGRTPQAVIENLKLPEFAAEFSQIYDEVNGS